MPTATVKLPRRSRGRSLPPSFLGLDMAGAPIALDIGRLIGTHLGIQGNSGAGKSHTLRKIVELALTEGGAQVLVLDVEDEFHTLRERFGRLVIAGGEQGDCPVDVERAPALAHLLLETGISAVIQLNDLGLDGQRAFIARFLDALIDAPRELWHPALVVLDEAHRAAPQRGSSPSLASVVRFMSQARKRGFTGVLATQRLAKVSKDAIGDVNNWLMGRVGTRVDREAIADELGLRPSSEEAMGLRSLEPGTFWGYGPAIAAEPTLLRVGDVVTKHLRIGELSAPVPPAPDTVRAALARFAASIQAGKSEEPDEGATGPSHNTASAARIAELERKVRTGEAAVADERAKRLAAERETAALRRRVDEIAALLGAPLYEEKEGSVLDHKPPAEEAPVTRAKVRKAELSASSTPSDISGYAEVLGKVLAAHHPRRLTRRSLALLAHRSHRSSAFRPAIAELVHGGYAYEVDSHVQVTEAGVKRFAGGRAEARSPAEILALWRSKFPPAARRMLDTLVAAYPSALSREAIAERANISPTSSGLGSGLSELVRNGLVEKHRKEFVAAGALADLSLKRR